MDRREVSLVELLQWRCRNAIHKGRTADEYHDLLDETINSSFWLYYDAANASAMTWIVEMAKKWVGSSDVPTGFASFPRDILPPPREWAERFFNIQRWTEMPRGGHFAAMEKPELLAKDIRAFFRPLRKLSKG